MCYLKKPSKGKYDDIYILVRYNLFRFVEKGLQNSTSCKGGEGYEGASEDVEIGIS